MPIEGRWRKMRSTVARARVFLPQLSTNVAKSTESPKRATATTGSNPGRVHRIDVGISAEQHWAIPCQGNDRIRKHAAPRLDRIRDDLERARILTAGIHPRHASKRFRCNDLMRRTRRTGKGRRAPPLARLGQIVFLAF